MLHTIVENLEYGISYMRKKYIRNLVFAFSVTVSFAFIFCYVIIFDFNQFEDFEEFSKEFSKSAYLQLNDSLIEDVKSISLEEEKKIKPELPKSQKELNIIKVVEVDNQNFLKNVDTTNLNQKKEPEKKIENKEKQNQEDDTPINYSGSIDSYVNYLMKNIPYPDSALVRKLNYELIVTFIVSKRGEITQVDINKFPETEWGKSVISIIEKSPRWKPVEKNGQARRMIVTIPLEFYK